MHNIDFLPVEHRQRYARRRMLIWRQIIAVAICAVIVASALYQQHARRGVLTRLAAVKPKYDLARQQTDQLNQLQAELKDAQAIADLVTYLRHPWPRTQLLAELLRPLPEEITLTGLEIAQRQPAGGPRTALPALTDKPQGEPALKQPPAVEDLKRLREERGRTQTVVVLEGVTTESEALHRYLGHLNDGTLFSNVELESFEAERAGEPSKVLRFVATLQVEPAYGVPGGPTGPPASAVARVEAAPMPTDPSHRTSQTQPNTMRP